MPSYCCVPSCKTKFIKGANVQFFRFPLKNETLTKQWIKAIDRIDFTPTKGTRICSKHFTDNDYLLRPIANIKRLKSNAIPSVFNTTNDTFNASSSLYRQFSKQWKLARMQMKEYEQSSYVKEIDVRTILNQQNEPQINQDCDDKKTMYCRENSPTNRCDNVVFIKSQPEDDDYQTNIGNNGDLPNITHTEVQTSKSLLRPIILPLKRQIKSLKRTIERRDKTIRNLRQRLELLTSIKEEIQSDGDEDNCSEISSTSNDESDNNNNDNKKIIKIKKNHNQGGFGGDCR